MSVKGAAVRSLLKSPTLRRALRGVRGFGRRAAGHFGFGAGGRAIKERHSRLLKQISGFLTRSPGGIKRHVLARRMAELETVGGKRRAFRYRRLGAGGAFVGAGGLSYGARRRRRRVR